MKRVVLAMMLMMVVMLAACVQNKKAANDESAENKAMGDTATVYVTRDITPESLVKIYEAAILCTL